MSVTKDCYAIVEQDKGINYAYGALNGFSRSLMKEMNRYCMKIIDLDETSMEQKYIISLLKTEMSNNQKLLIGYRNGSRFVQKVQSKEIKSECEKTVFEDNKQYIIVGGMGGIGRKIISKITKNTNSHIIVIGRKKREELNDIESGVLKFEKIYGISNSSLLDYIFSIKQFIEELIQQGGNKPQPAKRKINSKLTYKWLLKEDKIYELKKLLIDYELIDNIDFQSFKAIFSETPITQIKKAITWKNENVTQLIYLIKQLKENKVIDSTKTNFDYKQLYSCFVKNNDEIFTEKAKSLKTDIEIKISADFKLITEDIVNKLTK